MHENVAEFVKRRRGRIVWMRREIYTGSGVRGALRGSIKDYLNDYEYWLRVRLRSRGVRVVQGALAVHVLS